MQRMFARQISLDLDLAVGDKHAIARMLTQVGEATYPPTYSPVYHAVVQIPTHLLTSLLTYYGPPRRW